MIEVKKTIAISNPQPKTGGEVFSCIESAYQRFIVEMHVVKHTPHMEWSMSKDNKQKLCDFINNQMGSKKFKVENELTVFGIPIKTCDSNLNSIYIQHW